MGTVGPVYSASGFGKLHDSVKERIDPWLNIPGAVFITLHEIEDYLAFHPLIKKKKVRGLLGFSGIKLVVMY